VTTGIPIPKFALSNNLHFLKENGEDLFFRDIGLSNHHSRILCLPLLLVSKKGVDIDIRNYLLCRPQPCDGVAIASRFHLKQMNGVALLLHRSLDELRRPEQILVRPPEEDRIVGSVVDLFPTQPE